MSSLRGFALLWGSQQALLLLFSGLATRFQQAQACLLLLSLLSSLLAPSPASLPLLCTTIAARLIDMASAAPHAWESFYWSIETDAALLLPALLSFLHRRSLLLPLPEVERVLNEAATTICAQLACFYASAAMFKMNWSFLDHRFSCAPIYVAQILVGYSPAATSTATSPLAAYIVSLSPFVVLTGEMTIGASLAIAAASRGRTRGAFSCVGVLLALLLHLGIALTPPPNNVGAFSVIMSARLFFFAPEVIGRLCSPQAWSLLGASALVLSAAIAAAAAAAAASSGGSAASEGGIGQLGIMFFAGLDWSVPCYVFQMILVGRGVIEQATCHGEASPRILSFSSSSSSPLHGVAGDKTSVRPAPGCRGVRALLVWIAAVHSFALPILGLQDLGGSNMFGNLRMQGGSNHLFLPTSVLQPWLPEPVGGIFRVESTNSTAISSLYPGEVTAVLSPAAKALLRATGHSGRQFNFAMGRVLGAWVLPPPSSNPPVRYSVPASELRRMLEEARALSLPFHLTYTRLPRGGGDEAWRADTSYPSVNIVENGHTRECSMSDSGVCRSNEIALLPPLRTAERLLGVWNPYPILDEPEGHDWRGSRQVHCFGP